MAKRKKHLTRSNDKILGGVLGSIAEYFGFDKTWGRLIFVALSIVLGHVVGGIILYAIAMEVMPLPLDEPDDIDENVIEGEFKEKK